MISTANAKALNRIRHQIGNCQLGILPDVGKPHAKGYRFAVGKHADGSYARFWLGQEKTEAQHRAEAYLIVWADIISQGGHCWTQERIDAARGLAERKINLIRDVVTSMRQTAVGFEQHAATTRQNIDLLAPQTAGSAALVSAPPTTGTGPTLYQAIDAYLESFGGKRRSESHKWRAEQILKVNLKHAREDCELSRPNSSRC
jgi:hypothetical protein